MSDQLLTFTANLWSLLMNKFLLILSLCFASNIFAVTNTQITQQIYCPQSINCMSGNPGSCNLSQNNSKYFKLSKISNGSSYISSGTYSFQSVSSSFHSFYTDGFCEYSIKSGVNTYNLRLEIKPEANIEAYDNFGWLPVGGGLHSGEVTCKNTSSTSCPLKNRLGFVVHNLNVSNGIKAISNGINLINNSNYGNLVTVSKYIAITDEDALIACGNVDTCSIDITSWKSLKYGSIIIDMNTMSILEINNILPDKIKIRKIEPFNSIEISYHI